MKNKTLLWYWNNNNPIINLGESFSIEICKHFGVAFKEIGSAQKGDFEEFNNQCLYIVGSGILNKSIYNNQCENIHIWGLGAGKKETLSSINKNIVIHGVRGPETRDALKLPKETPVGDPGFLIPEIHKATRVGGEGVTYIPHWQTLLNCDKESVKKITSNIGADRLVNVRFNKNTPFKTKLSEILESDFILTSSLHTAIICIGYNIPWAPLQIPGEKIGGGYHPLKWIDLASSLNKEKFTFTKNYKEASAWHENNDIKPPCMKRMVEAFPFRQE